MLPEQIASLAPALTEFLGSFRNCLGECRTVDHFATYCRGLLSHLGRKSVEPIAVSGGSTVRALQLFLTHRFWDHLRLRDRLAERILRRHAPASGEYKYFVSNAPPHTDLELMLKVAFRRAEVEHLFRLAKGEAGLSHFEIG